MNSLILNTATRYLLPLLVLFALFLLLRGHNEPGGGFVGGLVVAAALALYALANGTVAARRLVRVQPERLIAGGLLIAVASGLVGARGGQPFLTGVWWEQTIPVLGKFGTPFLFDVGVMLVVVGITVTILFSLMEE